MPLQVNEAAIKELATLTGVDAEKLKSELVVDAATAPTETKIKELLTETVIMKKTDHAALLDNTGKEKFDHGKTRALTDLVKVALPDSPFEVTQGMTREDVWAKIHSVAKTNWEKEAGKDPDKKAQEWASEKEKLQKLITDKEQELAAAKQAAESEKFGNTKREKVLSALAVIPFSETDSKILSKQREVVLKNILSSYDLKVEDGKDVYYKDGQKLVDSLLNPKKIEDIVAEESVIFPTSKTPTGRGDQSSKSGNHTGSLDAELAQITDVSELTKLLEARGLSPMNAEGQAVIRKWSELRSKK